MVVEPVQPTDDVGLHAPITKNLSWGSLADHQPKHVTDGEAYRQAVKSRLPREEYLQAVKDRLQKEGLSAQTAVVIGDPAEAVIEYAKTNGVDLIILGTHGRSGPSRWFFGSVAEKISRHSPVPVLMVAPTGSRTG